MKLLVPWPFLPAFPSPLHTRRALHWSHAPRTSAPKDPRTDTHTYTHNKGTPADKAVFTFLI